MIWHRHYLHTFFIIKPALYNKTNILQINDRDSHFVLADYYNMPHYNLLPCCSSRQVPAADDNLNRCPPMRV